MDGDTLVDVAGGDETSDEQVVRPQEPRIVVQTTGRFVEPPMFKGDEADAFM